MGQDNNTEKGSFVRWQRRQIEAMGNAINLLLSLCLATMGFVIAKLLDNNFKFQNCMGKSFVILGSAMVLVTTILLLILIYNRLQAFRNTTQRARKREKKEEKEKKKKEMEEKKDTIPQSV